MHANAGTRLRAKINLLHPTLVSTYQGYSIAESSAANMSNNVHEIAGSEISSAPAPDNEDVADLASEQLASSTTRAIRDQSPAPPEVRARGSCLPRFFGWAISYEECHAECIQ
jgi:hypothetical protein